MERTGAPGQMIGSLLFPFRYTYLVPQPISVNWTMCPPAPRPIMWAQGNQAVKAQERTAGQMNAATRPDKSQVTLIDATHLDDEQFNDLISSIDPSQSLLPLLFAVLILLALATIA